MRSFLFDAAGRRRSATLPVVGEPDANWRPARTGTSERGGGRASRRVDGYLKCPYLNQEDVARI